MSLIDKDLRKLQESIEQLAPLPARLGPPRAYTEGRQMYLLFRGGQITEEASPRLTPAIEAPLEDQAEMLLATLEALAAGMRGSWRICWRQEPEIRTDTFDVTPPLAKQPKFQTHAYIYCRLCLEQVDLTDIGVVGRPNDGVAGARSLQNEAVEPPAAVQEVYVEQPVVEKPAVEKPTYMHRVLGKGCWLDFMMTADGLRVFMVQDTGADGLAPTLGITLDRDAAGQLQGWLGMAREATEPGG